MGVIERWTHYVCPDCGGDEHDGGDCLRCGSAADWVDVEVVRADAYRGAVDALQEIAAHTAGFEPSWPAERARAALRAMGVEPSTAGGQ